MRFVHIPKLNHYHNHQLQNVFISYVVIILKFINLYNSEFIERLPPNCGKYQVSAFADNWTVKYVNCHCDWYIEIFPCRLYCIICLLGRTSYSFLITETLLNYPDSTFPCKLPHHVILSEREIRSKLSLEIDLCTVSVVMGSTTDEPGRTKRVAKWYHGGLASASAAMCTHPLDLLKVHLQTQQKVQLGLVGKYRTAIHAYSLLTSQGCCNPIYYYSHITTSGQWLFVL